MLTWVAVVVMVSLGLIIIVRTMLKQRLQEQKKIDKVGEKSVLETNCQPLDNIEIVQETENGESLLCDENNDDGVLEWCANNQTKQHKDTVVMFVYTKDGIAIEGLDVIGLMSYYSMLCDASLGVFYRYDNEIGEGEPWFGMIGIYDDEFQRFDLNELSKKRYSGLAFFVSLPHSQPLPAFDAMVQIVSMIANQLSADIYYKDAVTYELLPINDAWINATRTSLQE